MKGLSIKFKTIVMSSVIMALLIVLGGAGISAVDQLGAAIKVLSQQSLPAVRNMTLVDMMHDGASATVYKSVVKGSAAKAESQAEYNEIFETLNGHLAEIEKLGLGDELMKQIASAKVAIEQYKKDGQIVLDSAAKDLKVEAELAQFDKSFEYLEKELSIIGDAIEKDANTQSSGSLVKADELRQRTQYFVIFSVILSAIISFLAYGFMSGLTKNLLVIVRGLKEETEMIVGTSQSMAEVAGKLSEASTEQAASLQETVASIDEISAMISRNADSALTSAKMSERSTIIAQQGKEKSEQMMQSISAISTGNDEIIGQMQKSNSEISEIVKVIQDIGQKTQVINDIVFQTKLLSFNASVEAARAGEHGKGFAVVAEEVGNLASMSGKAAAEITEMLTKSVNRVTSIVEGTQSLMGNLIKQSKEKVETGAATSKECTTSLDDILSNVSSVNEMVREISTASQEQATGVREVNKAMSELDQVTQSNSAIAQDSSRAASALQSQADRLNELVFELNGIVGGSAPLKVEARRPVETKKTPTVNNVVSIKSSAKKPASQKQPLRKAVGLEFEAPSNNDPRFEDS